jgi:hypothetical protein
MGSLMQLMALPAACMLFAWMGRGGANAIARLLCKLVAMMAVGDATRGRVVARAAMGTKTFKAARASGSLVAVGRSAPKDGRIARNPVPPRTGIVDPLLRMRRLRPRLAAGSTGI